MGKTYGELIDDLMNRLVELHKSMGYTVTEITVTTQESSEPTIYSFTDEKED